MHRRRRSPARRMPPARPTNSRMRLSRSSSFMDLIRRKSPPTCSWALAGIARSRGARQWRVRANRLVQPIAVQQPDRSLHPKCKHRRRRSLPRRVTSARPRSSRRRLSRSSSFMVRTRRSSPPTQPAGSISLIGRAARRVPSDRALASSSCRVSRRGSLRQRAGRRPHRRAGPSHSAPASTPPGKRNYARRGGSADRR
jgi:hypothetical protein